MDDVFDAIAGGLKKTEAQLKRDLHLGTLLDERRATQAAASHAGSGSAQAPISPHSNDDSKIFSIAGVEVTATEVEAARRQIDAPVQPYRAQPVKQRTREEQEAYERRIFEEQYGLNFDAAVEELIAADAARKRRLKNPVNKAAPEKPLEGPAEGRRFLVPPENLLPAAQAWHPDLFPEAAVASAEEASKAYALLASASKSPGKKKKKKKKGDRSKSPSGAGKGRPDSSSLDSGHLASMPLSVSAAAVASHCVDVILARVLDVAASALVVQVEDAVRAQVAASAKLEEKKGTRALALKPSSSSRSSSASTDGVIASRRRAADGRITSFECKDLEDERLRALRLKRQGLIEAKAATARNATITRFAKERDRTAAFAALQNHTAANALLATERARVAQAEYEACIAQLSPAALAAEPKPAPPGSLAAVLRCAVDVAVEVEAAAAAAAAEAEAAAEAAEAAASGQAAPIEKEVATKVEPAASAVPLKPALLPPQPSPMDWSCLSTLEWLDLSGNGLNGPIPRGFRFLGSLRALHLQNNAFSGNLPTWLGSSGHLPRLLELNLKHNRFDGTLAPLKGSLRLRHLWLDGNLLHGPLASLLPCPRLETLSVPGNQLGGAVGLVEDSSGANSSKAIIGAAGSAGAAGADPGLGGLIEDKAAAARAAHARALAATQAAKSAGAPATSKAPGSDKTKGGANGSSGASGGGSGASGDGDGSGEAAGPGGDEADGVVLLKLPRLTHLDVSHNLPLQQTGLPIHFIRLAQDALLRRFKRMQRDAREWAWQGEMARVAKQHEAQLIAAAKVDIIGKAWLARQRPEANLALNDSEGKDEARGAGASAAKALTHGSSSGTNITRRRRDAHVGRAQGDKALPRLGRKFHSAGSSGAKATTPTAGSRGGRGSPGDNASATEESESESEFEWWPGLFPLALRSEGLSLTSEANLVPYPPLPRTYAPPTYGATVGGIGIVKVDEDGDEDKDDDDDEDHRAGESAEGSGSGAGTRHQHQHARGWAPLGRRLPSAPTPGLTFTWTAPCRYPLYMLRRDTVLALDAEAQQLERSLAQYESRVQQAQQQKLLLQQQLQEQGKNEGAAHVPWPSAAESAAAKEVAMNLANLLPSHEHALAQGLLETCWPEPFDPSFGRWRPRLASQAASFGATCEDPPAPGLSFGAVPGAPAQAPHTSSSTRAGSTRASSFSSSSSSSSAGAGRSAVDAFPHGGGVCQPSGLLFNPDEWAMVIAPWRGLLRRPKPHPDPLPQMNLRPLPADAGGSLGSGASANVGGNHVTSGAAAAMPPRLPPPPSSTPSMNRGALQRLADLARARPDLSGFWFEYSCVPQERAMGKSEGNRAAALASVPFYALSCGHFVVLEEDGPLDVDEDKEELAASADRTTALAAGSPNGKSSLVGVAAANLFSASVSSTAPSSDASSSSSTTSSSSSSSSASSSSSSSIPNADAVSTQSPVPEPTSSLAPSSPAGAPATTTATVNGPKVELLGLHVASGVNRLVALAATNAARYHGFVPSDWLMVRSAAVDAAVIDGTREWGDDDDDDDGDSDGEDANNGEGDRNHGNKSNASAAEAASASSPRAASTKDHKNWMGRGRLIRVKRQDRAAAMRARARGIPAPGAALRSKAWVPPLLDPRLGILGGNEESVAADKEDLEAPTMALSSVLRLEWEPTPHPSDTKESKKISTNINR